MSSGVSVSENPPFFRQTIYNTKNKSKVQIDNAKQSKWNFHVVVKLDI